MNLKDSQKGVSVYLAIIVMVVLLGIGLGISTLLVSQIKMMRGMRYSVVAIYAADTGIERVLYAIRKEGHTPPLLPDQPFVDVILDNGATYTVTITAFNAGAGTATINSRGTYQKTHRAIEITY